MQLICDVINGPNGGMLQRSHKKVTSRPRRSQNASHMTRIMSYMPAYIFATPKAIVDHGSLDVVNSY